MLLAMGVGIGLVAPGLANLARPLLGPSIWVLLVVAAVRIDPGQSLRHIRRPAPIIGSLIWMLAITPMLCFGLLQVMPVGPGLTIALIMMAGSAPLMSTPSLAQLLGLDSALAMLVMIAATALIPFTVPFIALHVLDMDIGVDPLQWSLNLTAFISSAVIAAAVLRRIVGRQRIDAAKGPLDLATVFLLLLFAVAIMDGVADRLMADPPYVLMVVAIAFAAYLAFLITGTVYGRLFGRRLGDTIGFVSANRNVGVFLAVLPAGSHPDIFLYFAIWQLPMYIMPVLLMPLYRRWSVAA